MIKQQKQGQHNKRKRVTDHLPILSEPLLPPPKKIKILKMLVNNTRQAGIEKEEIAPKTTNDDINHPLL